MKNIILLLTFVSFIWAPIMNFKLAVWPFLHCHIFYILFDLRYIVYLKSINNIGRCLLVNDKNACLCLLKTKILQNTQT